MAGQGTARAVYSGQPTGCPVRIASRGVASLGAAWRGQAGPGKAGQGPFWAIFGVFLQLLEDREMTEGKHYSWQTGLPTGPDVALIRKRWPDLKVGDRIEYQEIADLLGIKAGSTRWKTVTKAWRKRALDDGYVVKSVPGKAFVVANAEQIIDDTFSTLKHISRSARRQVVHLMAVRDTDSQTRAVVDHQARLMHAVEQDTKAKRQLALPSTAVRSMPKINLVA
jgi:hypothetical protein